jgi:putative flavoprotein involved in K+ transport
MDDDRARQILDAAEAAQAARVVETVVVGAGHAGLVMSRLLSQAGREHVVLDRRSSLGGGWQDRWDAFRLVSPNWTVGVPGLDYAGDDPDGFMPRDELVEHWRRYARVIAAPVELETNVTRLEAIDGGTARFRLTSSRGAFHARNVIVAAGPFQTPHVPAVGAGLAASIVQLHSHDYRRPDQLPPGRVLLIGSGQSGVQLAEELHEAGREVILGVGRCGRAPRRYRGRDFFWWMRQLATRGHEAGGGLPTAASMPTPAARFRCNPQLSGHRGGHDVNLRRMAADGIRLVGRLQGADGVKVRFAADLRESLRVADGFFGEQLEPRFDRLATATGETYPPDEPDSFDFEPPEVTELDLAAEGVSSVLWTSGYRPALDWIDLPLFDEWGLPRTVEGEPEIPGISFIGLPWSVDMGSANLIGLVRDAEALAARW